MKSMEIRLFALICVCVTFSGCVNMCQHGGTEHWWYSMTTKDPWSVEPSDGDKAVDETQREFWSGVGESQEKLSSFKRKVAILPSANIRSFITAAHPGGQDALNAMAVSFAGNLFAAFGEMNELNITNSADNAIAMLSSDDIGKVTPGDAASFMFNIHSANTAQYQKLLQINGQLQYGFKGSASGDVVIYDQRGKRRMQISASVTASDDSELIAQQKLMKSLAEELSKKYRDKMSSIRGELPSGYITRMRGDGLFAEVNIGSEFGIRPGMSIEFFRKDHENDLINGGETICETVLGTGKVMDYRYIDKKTSWIKINDYCNHRIKCGELVRAMNRGR